MHSVRIVIIDQTRAMQRQPANAKQTVGVIGHKHQHLRNASQTPVSPSASTPRLPRVVAGRAAPPAQKTAWSVLHQHPAPLMVSRCKAASHARSTPTPSSPTGIPVALSRRPAHAPMELLMVQVRTATPPASSEIRTHARSMAKVSRTVPLLRHIKVLRSRMVASASPRPVYAPMET